MLTNSTGKLKIADWLFAVLGFFICWIVCSLSFGFLGFALGVFPSFIIGLILFYVWPILVFVGFIIALFFIKMPELSINKKSTQSPTQVEALSPKQEPQKQKDDLTNNNLPVLQEKLDCADIGKGDDFFQKVANQADLPDHYYNRYHEGVIYDLCKGDQKSVNATIDYGGVKLIEVENIAKVLHKEFIAQPRTPEGEMYERVYQELDELKFNSLDMMLSMAEKDNIAHTYIKYPNSKFAALVDRMLTSEYSENELKIILSLPKKDRVFYYPDLYPEPLAATPKEIIKKKALNKSETKKEVDETNIFDEAKKKCSQFIFNDPSEIQICIEKIMNQ